MKPNEIPLAFLVHSEECAAKMTANRSASCVCGRDKAAAELRRLERVAAAAKDVVACHSKTDAENTSLYLRDKTMEELAAALEGAQLGVTKFSKEEFALLLDALAALAREGSFKPEQSRDVESLWSRLRWLYTYLHSKPGGDE